MKKTLLLLLAGLGMAVLPACAWNTVGHKAVAQIAQNHLDKNARKALRKYLKGTDIVEISSLADRNYYKWHRDIGWECSNPKILRRQPSDMDALPTNIEPWCHSYSVDSLCNTYRHNREGDLYVRNCIMDLDWLIHNLKEHAAEMEPREREKQIALVVHLVGDFHCPMHTLFIPQAPTGGKYSIYIEGKKINIHTFWDSSIWKYLNPDWTWYDFAKAADTASKAEIERITQGDVYDWGKASAQDVWPAHHLTGCTKEQRQLGLDYPESMRGLAYKQIRNAGYRLAKALNYIFE